MRYHCSRINDNNAITTVDGNENSVFMFFFFIVSEQIRTFLSHVNF